ncbi:MAG TPA: HNH endonuclease [Phycisphaerae bacterium]|nr:HNH endonuclease [Phycisphaerae bacterium]HPM23737.1 HNH endonuclease [Phycisphaerae bacterium]
MMIAAESALSANVLLLNRLYMAVRVVSARRALTLLYRELAEVVSVDDGQYLAYDFNDWVEVSQAKRQFEPERYDWVRTVRFQIAVPKIIRLLGYDKLPAVGVKLNRRNLFARDQNRCQYCGKRYATTELSLDHVIPRSQGGDNSWENIVCACIHCNVKKGGRTPQQAHMTLINHPVKPKRSPVLTIKLSDSKYASWKQFLDFAYWNVELK